MRSALLTVLLGALFLAGISIGPVAGFYAGLAYDRRPANTPAPVHIHFLWIDHTYSWPLSLKAQGAADKVGLAECSASIDRLNARSAVISADAQTRVNAAQSRVQAAETLQRHLSGYHVDTSSCPGTLSGVEAILAGKADQ